MPTAPAPHPISLRWDGYRNGTAVESYSSAAEANAALDRQLVDSISPASVTTIDLTGFVNHTEDPIENLGAPALVFGELVKLAAPIVQNFHGDLYHDAQWLARTLVGPGPHVFSWACDTWGTAIGTSTELVRAQRIRSWQFVVYVGEDRRWKLDITKLA